MDSFQIPEQNLSQLKARIEKLAKRAARLKLAGPVLTVTGSKQVEVKPEGDLPYFRTVYTVTLSGVDVVKLNGWTLAAVLDAQYNEDGTLAGNILRAVPEGPQVPETYRTAPSNCDHCRTVRRRNQTVLVVNEAAQWKQVGTDCIKDFLGHASAEAYAELAQIIIDARDLAEGAEDDDYMGGGSRTARKYATEDILQLAAAAVRLYGWRSNKVAQDFGGQSTSGLVSEWLSSSAEQRKDWEHRLVPDETDIALAGNVRTWLSSLSSRRELNDYMYNLSLMGSLEVVTPRNFGILCAAIVTYSKEQEREINRRKRFAEDAASVYVGTVGERMTFENLTLAFITSFSTDFGVTHLYKFRDAAGNIIAWFSSNDMSWEQGAVIPALVARVKAHEDYKGVKQTVITRAAIPVPPPTPEEKKAKREQSKREKPLRLARSVSYRLRGDGDAWRILQEVIDELEAELKAAQ